MRTTLTTSALLAAGALLGWLAASGRFAEAFAQDKKTDIPAPTVAGAGEPGEPLSGQPPKGSKPSITDFDYQIKYHRAFEAVLGEQRRQL
jgi:hypothetical protein